MTIENHYIVGAAALISIVIVYLVWPSSYTIEDFKHNIASATMPCNTYATKEQIEASGLKNAIPCEGYPDHSGMSDKANQRFKEVKKALESHNY